MNDNFISFKEYIIHQLDVASVFWCIDIDLFDEGIQSRINDLISYIQETWGDK